MNREESLRARLERVRRRHRLPALGAARLAVDGETEVAVVGTRIRGEDVALRTGDRWHIGSCAKAITASLYARLAEGEAAAWGIALPELFPELAAGIHPGWRRVTIDDVLVHRAGLPANLDDEALRSGLHDTRPLVEQRTAATAAALAGPPRRPGSFRYSNLGYIVAGAAIERITGHAWERAVCDHVLGPLGIRSAGFGAPAGDAPWGHLPRWRGLGRGRPVDPGRPGEPGLDEDNPPVMGPAGTLHLTLADWARFVRVFLRDGATLLEPGSLTRLLTVPAGPGPRQAMGWAYPRGTRRAAAGVGFGQQGSNRRWVATALVSQDRRRAALVVTNDGRARLLSVTARLASELLPSP